jgi:perosamine synthetase
MSIPSQERELIRLTVPTIEEDDLAVVCEVLASGFLVQGAQVETFEAAVASVAGTRHAVAVTNCTAALQMALMALDVRPGDRVVTTAYSWLSTANVIELCGAMPVFVDVEPDTFNLCPDALAVTLERLSGTAGTARSLRAVLPVHAFGGMADIERIGQVAARYGLPVVEDAACALGASWAGHPAGSVGVMGCFSFHPRKAVTTGEGGVITTNDGAFANSLRALRNHGQQRGPDGVTRFVAAGFNTRMTEFQGALGVSQMAKLDRIVTARRTGAARYDRLLAGTPVRSPAVPPPSCHVYQSYVVLLPESVDRVVALGALRACGVEATIGTWNMPMTDFFRAKYGFRPGDFPNADAVFARALTLPLHPALTEADQEYVVRALLDAVDAAVPA